MSAIMGKSYNGGTGLAGLCAAESSQIQINTKVRRRVNRNIKEQSVGLHFKETMAVPVQFGTGSASSLKPFWRGIKRHATGVVGWVLKTVT